MKVVNNETISVDGKPIKVVSNRDPLKLPWAELDIDIVIEVYIKLVDLFTIMNGSITLIWKVKCVLS